MKTKIIGVTFTTKIYRLIKSKFIFLVYKYIEMIEYFFTYDAFTVKSTIGFLSSVALMNFLKFECHKWHVLLQYILL